MLNKLIDFSFRNGVTGIIQIELLMILLRISVFSLLVCGIFQSFLLFGLVWNFCFPLVPLVLLLFSFLSFKKDKFLASTLPILIFLIVLEAGFTFISMRNIESTNGNEELKILSYNVFFRNKSPKQVISIVKKQDPDILLVQEVTPKLEELFRNSFSKKYKYVSIKSFRGTHGIGVFSKYKIDKTDYLNNTYNLPYAQLIELDIKGKKVQLINTHLASPAVALENSEEFLKYYLPNYRERKEQVISLNNLVDKQGKFHCQIIAGDLNLVASEPTFKRLKWNWVNTNRTPLRWKRLNFPNSGRISPFLTLDYIMARGKLECLESGVIKEGSSDHLAIYSRIKL